MYRLTESFSADGLRYEGHVKPGRGQHLEHCQWSYSKEMAPVLVPKLVLNKRILQTGALKIVNV